MNRSQTGAVEGGGLKVTRFVTPTLCALALALCLSACGDGGKSTSSPEVAPLRVSGGGSAQFLVRGGDNSIAEYGTEASHSELTRAARVLHRYLTARAARDWELACDYLTTRQRNQLAQLAASSHLTSKSCAGALSALSAKVSTATAHALTVVDAASLRSKGESAFLLYHGAGHTGYFIAMAREGGTWKVAALDPTALL
jgi:hypothetical protein